MTKESSDQNSFRTFEEMTGTSDYDTLVFAGRWFENQIHHAVLKSNVEKGEVENLESNKFLNLLVGWGLGMYASRWFDPQVHTVLTKEITSNSEAEAFVFGKLSFLAGANPALSSTLGLESPCLQFFKRSRISPGVNHEDFDIVGIGFPKPLAEALKPSWEYLSPLFRSNHWLLLLLYCIAAYQFLGLDKNLMNSLKD